MRIDLRNETEFRSDDVRRLVSAALRAVGFLPGARPPRFDVVPSRSSRVSGFAALGTDRRFHGLRARLRLPPRRLWTDDTWRDIVATTVHECMHLVGSEHRDMTEGQYRCTLPLPAWAADLQLRDAEPAPTVSREERVAAARGDRLEHARAMLKKAETRSKRAETIRKKWARRLRELERRQG